MKIENNPDAFESHRERCGKALNKLADSRAVLRDGIRYISEDWSSTFAEQVLAAYGAMSAEYAHKAQAREELEVFLLFCQDQGGSFSARDHAYVDDLTNWICSKPTDTVRIVKQMLDDAARHEEAA